MTDFEWVAAFVVAALSAARITRLITWDHYPPTMWLRRKWHDLTNDGDWSVLVDCGYCFGLWAGGFVVGTGWLSLHFLERLHPAWWAFNGWMAVGYLAAIVMAYDGDED